VAEDKSKQAKRKHHFTPVVYLQNFTDANRVLHVVSLFNGKRFDTSPEGIGFEKDLYKSDADDVDANAYEDVFAEFEGQAASVIQKSIESRALPATDEDLNTLFNFIAFQSVRVPGGKRNIAAPIEHSYRIIEDMLASSKSLYEHHARKAGIDTTIHTYEQFADGQDQYEMTITTDAFIELAMRKMRVILPLVARRNWSIMYSDHRGEEFVVTDYPVALRWSDGRPHGFYGPGHASVNTDLTIPLSSSVALIGRFEAPVTTGAASRRQVAALNWRTISGATRFVAASSDDFIVEGENGILSASEFGEIVRKLRACSRKPDP
jgi:hypothetical protein